MKIFVYKSQVSSLKYHDLIQKKMFVTDFLCYKYLKVCIWVWARLDYDWIFYISKNLGLCAAIHNTTFIIQCISLALMHFLKP